MKERLLSALVLAICIMGSVQAQDKVDGGLTVDLVSNYIWRGQHSGDVSIQPELWIGWKGLSLSAWGSMGLSNNKDAREIDLTLSYETGGFSVGIVDYWNDENDSRYFYYSPFFSSHSPNSPLSSLPSPPSTLTGHSFEGYVGYDFGPVSVSWQTFFAGNDFNEDSGKRAWSSYFEVSAPFRLVTCRWQATAGLVPWACDYYATSGFSVTNLSLRATKDIKLSESFSLPLFAQIVANPASQDFYFLAGLTIKAF